MSNLWRSDVIRSTRCGGFDCVFESGTDGLGCLQTFSLYTWAFPMDLLVHSISFERYSSRTMFQEFVWMGEIFFSRLEARKNNWKMRNQGNKRRRLIGRARIHRALCFSSLSLSHAEQRLVTREAVLFRALGHFLQKKEMRKKHSFWNIAKWLEVVNVKLTHTSTQTH